MNVIPFISKTRFVYFNESTGVVTHIVRNKQDDLDQPCIEVDLDEVQPVLSHKIPLKDIIVEFDPIQKSYAIKKTKLDVELYDVNEGIYEFVTDADSPDIILTQDIIDKCWRVEIDKQLRANLLEARVGIDVLLTFSVTQKSNPNVLYKILRVPLKTLVDTSYYILPYSEPFEFEINPVSIYTSRRFDTYVYKVKK
jgi:hypothetical protein